MTSLGAEGACGAYAFPRYKRARKFETVRGEGVEVPLAPKLVYQIISLAEYQGSFGT